MNANSKFDIPKIAPNHFDNALILDMRLPKHRAATADFLSALACPNATQARRYLTRAENHTASLRADLQRFLTTPTSDHPLDRMVQVPGWQWDAARGVCCRLRRARVVERGRRAVWERMWAEEKMMQREAA